MSINFAFSCITCFLLGVLVTYCVFDPRVHLEWPQEVLLEDYQAVYCHPQKPTDPMQAEFYLGEAATLSRLTIRSGIGSLALSRRLSCALEGR